MDKWFDRYELQARVAPAIVVLLPVLFQAYILFPNLRDLASSLFGLVVLVAVSTLISNVTRNIGKRKEEALFRSWDGMPTSRFLRHLDTEIDEVTKNRYHQYLQCNVPNFTIPSEIDERQDKENTDQKYASAVNWLRQKNRNNSFVLSSNISYGFARNLWGMKPLAIMICILVLAGSLGLLYYRHGMAYKDVPSEVWWGIAFTLALLFILMFIVNAQWVHMKAKAYAKALLESCEESNETPKNKAV